ncbi:MAG TPA: hypothetical protein VG345_06165 [Bryobacteraceae bacterium]|nr:hypothetical protein [Bryobacteraceae bacterium]
MPGPIRISAAAAFTLLVCWRLGRLVIDRVRAPLLRVERELLSGITGASVLSLLVTVCCALHLARLAVFLTLGGVAIALSFIPGVRRAVATYSCPPLSAAARAFFGLTYAFYLVLYLSNSLAPEMSPDGAAYHLGLVYRYYRQAGFDRLTTNIYEYLSKGLEMLYLFAFAFGRHAAAATVHCAFLLALPLLILTYGRRIRRPWAGIGGAMLFYLSPVAGIDGVSAYTDVALAAAAFALFYLLEIWRENGAEDDPALLAGAGLVAGFCFAIKFTGAVAVLYAATIILWRRRPRALAPVLGSAAIVIFPWPLKNWLWTGNPAAPFFNRVFRNPYIHVSFESAYRHYFATYNLPEYHSLPWKLTVSGSLGGQIGPVFLLAPLALVSLRFAEGRRCLLAALFFLLPYPANIGARFLIPALPFIAFAMALAVDFSRYLPMALVMLAAVCAWPRTIRHYRAPAGTWQIGTAPWQAALGLTPSFPNAQNGGPSGLLCAPERYLEQRSAEYRIARMIDEHVPPDGRVWSTMQVAEAYERPDLLVSYQSAEGERIEDILATAIETDRQPLWNLRFTFAPGTLQELTFEQRNETENDIWSIGEVKFFLGQTEAHPAIQEVTATPFPWDAALATDGNPLTRWKSWEAIRPGMRWRVKFRAPVMLDRAELHCAHDQWAIDVRMVGVDARREKLEDPHYGDLRALAARTVKRRGIDYLLAGGNSRLAVSFASDPGGWKLARVSETDDATLYRIDSGI